MPINPNLPTPGLIKEKLTLSADLQTVLYAGQEIPTVHFVKVTVPSLLAYYGAGSAAAFALLSEMNAHGFSLRGYGNHTTRWAEQVTAHREEQERREKEIREHNERMAAIMATPAEIAKAVAERKQREDEIARKFGDSGKAAAFGGF
ncbi:DUF6971 family protein [[Curtobacterium] plantarum]|uniref:DUF6971 family protein n=1 Tax=[Curtobacterium] plantarum TaxID=221276 RepID=UPI000F080624|nr:hypothetical protein [[Curtobacterium] plantarum]RNA78733.1 hypothetical protein EBO33_01525 [[Curtobacterium] plantarum]